MKGWFFGFLSTLMLVSLCLLSGQSKALASESTEKLGTPHYNIGILSSAYGKGPNGKEVIYATANGDPAILNIIDPVSGKKVAVHSLNGASSAWGMVIDPDGNVYIAGGTNLYRYSPSTNSVENLGKPISSETALWHIQTDKKGRIYGGTYPNGKVFMYDPKTNQFKDYGQMVENQGYTRSITIFKKKVYVGIGVQKAHLIELDPKTGKKREILLPEKFQNQQTVFDLDAEGNLLFARVTPSSTLLVYDLKKKRWIDEIPGVKGAKVSPPGAKNLIYFNKDNELYSYNLKSRKLTATGYKENWSNKGMGWIRLNEPGFKGLSLVSIRYNGYYWIYNPKSGKSKEIQAEIEGQPIPIQSIRRGPNGNIFTSGYLSGGFSYYSPEENQFARHTGFGQAENMISTEKYLYLGVYSGGYVYQYDPSKPYDHDPTNIPEATNPRALFSLKEYEQDRPFGFAEGDGKVFIGTVPDYGKLGGALTVLDEQTEQYEVHRNIVENQSVISLQYKDGIVYGGTSVSGGLGVTPTETEAKLFAFDPQSNKKLFEITPLPGEKAIGALAFDDEGYLWGMSPGKIFKFDPGTGQIIQTKELFPFTWNGVGHYWRGAFLSFDSDGHFYGTTLGKLFKFNPETWETEILETNASLFAKDLDGNIYFSRGTDLYRYNR
ncbi:WD40 repeat domain-containing protein [Metabacillus arenae]|uniref:WD40 repeat domain-containing protein n=1 Tax=Metabacillus arenae TaxID=2771434 RepID=A0A926NI80_9BACI|nr:WD40 repeat domain-containing protein [Metabacillus arenae]MBD1380483.1 WD40 repeat domain-containing protein [Metabacillus arenae]